MLPTRPLLAFQQGGDFATQIPLLILLKKVCRKAYFTSQKGHHLKALKIMNDPYVPKNRDLYCRVKAHLCLQVVVSQNNDDDLSLTDKYKYMREALSFAKLAVMHRPDSEEYVYFYAGLLYCCYMYDLVVQPNTRSLEIKSRLAEVTYCHPLEENIAGVQQGLCALVINECKHLIGNRIGKRIKEDQLEDFLVSVKKNWRRQPNEVQRALLTPKKRRKELKVEKKKAPVRVPAAVELIRSCHQQKLCLLVRSDCQQRCGLPQRNAKCTVYDFHPSIPCQVRLTSKYCKPISLRS